MAKQFQEVPFRSFFQLGLTVNLVFAIPILGLLISFNIIDPILGLLFFIPFSLISVPIGVSLCWLIAKGSNWENTSASIKAMGVFMSQPYALILGGLLGFRSSEYLIGIAVTVLILIVGAVAGFYLSIFLAKQLSIPI